MIGTLRTAAGDYADAKSFFGRALAIQEKLGPDARLSVPTPEHYLPLLYVLGTRQEGESTTFPIEGVDGGSISMLAVRVGQ